MYYVLFWEFARLAARVDYKFHPAWSQRKRYCISFCVDNAVHYTPLLKVFSVY